MGTTIPSNVDNPKHLTDKKVNHGKDSVFKIVFKQVNSTHYS